MKFVIKAKLEFPIIILTMGYNLWDCCSYVMVVNIER